MGNHKRTKGQRMIYRTLDRKLKIEQEVNAPEERTFPAQSVLLFLLQEGDKSRRKEGPDCDTCYIPGDKSRRSEGPDCDTCYIPGDKSLRKEGPDCDTCYKPGDKS
jgi:hypothetical protein